MKLHRLPLALGALALALPLASSAWPGGHGHRGSHAERLSEKLDALELEPGTREEIDAQGAT